MNGLKKHIEIKGPVGKEFLTEFCWYFRRELMVEEEEEEVMDEEEEEEVDLNEWDESLVMMLYKKSEISCNCKECSFI